jgi:transcriptional regulator with XRE-family HTH domain
MTFADLVKARRRRQFLTQKALAAAVGVSLNTVQRWELGLSVPYPSTQRKLVDVLGVDAETLLAAVAETEGKDAA